MTLKKYGGALVVGAFLALVPLANAWAGVQKHVDGLTTYVWIDGLNPGESYQYNINGLNKTSARTVNSCGWVQLSFSYGETPPTSIKIASDRDLLPSATAINTAALPEQAKFCRNGVVVDALGNPTTAAAAFADSSGKFTFPGFTQNERQYVEYVGVPDTRSKKADACGLARFLHKADTPSSNFTSFTWAGTSYSLAALSDVHEVRCKTYKDGTVRKLVPTAL